MVDWHLVISAAEEIDVKLEQLKSFREAAVQGSFSKASRTLFMTQSAISMQIAALERELGIRLFERRGRQTALTDAGRVLLIYANQIADLVDESQRATGLMREDKASVLAIGASRTIGHYILPEVLRDVRKEYPGVQITMTVATSPQIASLTASGSIDIGLVERPIAEPVVEHRSFGKDELALIIPPDHRWARRDSIDPRELETEPFIARESESHTRAITEAALATLGIVLTPCMEIRSPEGVKAAVRAGLGVSILSIHTVRLELAAQMLQTVPLRGLRLERPLSIVLPPKTNGSKVLTYLTELLENYEHK